VVMTIIRVILAGLLAAAWSLVTFFVLPVIMLERATTPQAMKRSVSLIKNKWGDAVVGSFRIGLRIAESRARGWEWRNCEVTAWFSRRRAAFGPSRCRSGTADEIV